MKRQTQWIAIMLLTGATGLTTAAADSHLGSCDGLAFDDGRRVIGEQRVITETSRPGWVVKADRFQAQPQNSGYVLVEPADTETRLINRAPVVSREEIVLEPVAERIDGRKPMRQVFIRERLAPVAEGPLFSGPATIKERRYIKRTVHYGKAKTQRKAKATRLSSSNRLEAVGERTKCTLKRTTIRTTDSAGNLMERTGRSFERFGRRLVGAPEPVAERTFIVEPIYQRDSVPQWRETDNWQPDPIDYANPYR